MVKRLLLSPLFLVILLACSFVSCFVGDAYGAVGAAVCDVSEDTNPNSADPDATRNATTWMLTGYNVGWWKILLKWNVSDLVEKYNYGIYNEKVNIRVYARMYLDQVLPIGVEVYRITSDWSGNTATWNNQPDYSASNISYLYIDGVYKSNLRFYYFDISVDFLDVLDDGGSGFYGYMLKGLNYDPQCLQVDTIEAGSFEAAIFYGDYEETGEEEEDADTSIFMNFIVLFMIVGLPAVVLSMAGASSGWGLQGLLFGAFVGLGSGVMVGIIPFWFVFLITLFLVVFLYSIARRS